MSTEFNHFEYTQVFLITRCSLHTYTLHWRHNGCDGALNHQPHHCLLTSFHLMTSSWHSGMDCYKWQCHEVCEIDIIACPRWRLFSWFSRKRSSNVESASISSRHYTCIQCEYNLVKYRVCHKTLVGTCWLLCSHHNDVIMSAIESQITSLAIVYSTAFSGADQRKYQSFASLAFVKRITRWQVNSPHKGPVTRKMFPFDDVIMLINIWIGHGVIYKHCADLILTNRHHNPQKRILLPTIKINILTTVDYPCQSNDLPARSNWRVGKQSRL